MPGASATVSWSRRRPSKIAQPFDFGLGHFVEAAEFILDVVVRRVFRDPELLADGAIGAAGDPQLQRLDGAVRLGGVFADRAIPPRLFGCHALSVYVLSGREIASPTREHAVHTLAQASALRSPPRSPSSFSSSSRS